MAKTSAANLITELCYRLGWDSTAASQGRTDALKALNDAQKRICQPYSLQCLAKTGTVSVAIAGSTVGVPADMDTGKTYTIQKPATVAGAPTAELTYVPVDEWYERNTDTYLDYETTRPQVYTLVGTTFQFKPANGTAAQIDHPIIYQQMVTALADGGGFSVLPEGYEDTILMDNAEAYQMRIMNRPGWQDLYQVNREAIEAFYTVQRTTRETTGTDREQQERIVSKSMRSEVQP